MLAELYIENFAIIEKLHLRFSPGFNVLTGETGAGKSIIVDAVSTLLGGRADTSLVRSGESCALVEGLFHLDESLRQEILPALRREGLEGEDEGTLILAREIRREGRNICRVNGRAVALGVFRPLGQLLIDIHGQSEHLSLLQVKEHLELLDRFAGLDSFRAQVAEKVEELRRVRRALAELQRDERELARRADLLRYQVEEIKRANLQPGEEEELRTERTRLTNVERLIELSESAYRLLYAGGEEQLSITDLLSQALRSLTELEKIDPLLRERIKMLEEISLQLEDLASFLRDYRDRLEYNPARLEQVEERLALIQNLKRKYGDSIPEILAYGEKAARELASLSHSEERLEELRTEEDKLLHQIGEMAAELSARRAEAGKRLAEAVERELSELNMPRARFAVSIEQREAEEGVPVGEHRYAFDERGIDRVEFLIAPNPGEPLKPLVKIASGGETSRLMLALKTVLSAADRIPTLIFDEIDQGIGGRAGSIVGRKLQKLAERHQVLCVTHLPQLASWGKVHFRVQKEVRDGRTVASVRRLNAEERVEELAQMLGALTEATRQSAREMLMENRE